MNGNGTSLPKEIFFNINYMVSRWITQAVFKLLYRIDIKNETSLPANGPVIILPKHQYWTDIPLIMLSFDFPLHFVAKQELFRSAGVRTYLLLAGCIPLDREQSIKTLNSFKQLLSLLKEDGKVVIFPEGTYFPGVVGPGKARLIQMILQFQSQIDDQIPFIPVGIRYGDRKGWRRSVEIRIGHPLFAGGKAEAPSLADKVIEEITRLSCLPRC
jgi:1-acyl-sn-glycerol-3-phosphate acyltransferase